MMYIMVLYDLVPKDFKRFKILLKKATSILMKKFIIGRTDLIDDRLDR